MCIKCLMYKSPRLISWLLNTHQESFPILKPMNLLFGLWLGFPLFALRAYKSSPLLTLTGLAYSWCQHAFPELQSLCYSRINSIFGNLNLSQFNSLFRLTVVSILFFFGCAAGHAGSYFPHQGSNPCPLQWKRSLNHWPPGIPVSIHFY